MAEGRIVEIQPLSGPHSLAKRLNSSLIHFPIKNNAIVEATPAQYNIQITSLSCIEMSIMWPSKNNGAGNGNQTRIIALEGRGTINIPCQR